MENSLTDRENQPAALDVKVRIFTHLTPAPSENLLNKYAGLYMSGFNEAPWDEYEYKYTAEKARKEFTRLVSVALDSGGALIYLTYKGRPAGFSVVTNLGVFVRQLKKAEEYKRCPPNYKNPGRYFDVLSQQLKIPVCEFETVGYIASIVIDVRHRGKGYSKELLASSLKYLKDAGKKSALAWTANSVMVNVLSQAGFKLISGIGDKGEGVDFTAYHGAWYPTLVLPAERKTIQAAAPAVARHFLKLF